MEKMPPWARDLAALLSLHSSDGRSMWKIYQDLIRPISSDPEKAQRYGTNYDGFYAENCQSCLFHLPSCKYMKSPNEGEDKERKFMRILEGELKECAYMEFKSWSNLSTLR